jgi:hypothetical protein
MYDQIYAYSTSLIHQDQVFVTDYNGQSGDDFQLYYENQAQDYVLPATQANTELMLVQGSPEAGLTNKQNWDRFGIAFGGELAPLTAVTRDGLIGLVRPM